MSLELDWLEREERYRQRVTRLMTVAVILVAVLLGTGFYLRSRHIKQVREAASRAAAEQKLEEARRQREQFTADSTATAERYSSFMATYHAEPLEGLPLLAVPLPPGQPIRSFVERVWADYVKAIDPNATSEESITWFRQNYTEIMNEGPLRGRAILLPQLEQKGTRFEIQKSTFTQITRAQVEIGMREAPVEAPADTTGAGAAQSPASGGETTDMPAANEPASTPSGNPGGSTGEPVAAPAPPPAESGASTESGAPADSGVPAEVTPPATPPPAPAAGASTSTPVEPVPPRAAPQETLPAAPTPPDTVPNP